MASELATDRTAILKADARHSPLRVPTPNGAGPRRAMPHQAPIATAHARAHAAKATVSIRRTRSRYLPLAIAAALILAAPVFFVLIRALGANREKLAPTAESSAIVAEAPTGVPLARVPETSASPPNFDAGASIRAMSSAKDSDDMKSKSVSPLKAAPSASAPKNSYCPEPFYYEGGTKKPKLECLPAANPYGSSRLPVLLAPNPYDPAPRCASPYDLDDAGIKRWKPDCVLERR